MEEVRNYVEALSYARREMAGSRGLPLSTRLLYLSVAFRRRQRECYRRLTGVRTEGDWEVWTV